MLGSGSSTGDMMASRNTSSASKGESARSAPSTTSGQAGRRWWRGREACGAPAARAGGTEETALPAAPAGAFGGKPVLTRSTLVPRSSSTARRSVDPVELDEKPFEQQGLVDVEQ